MGSGGGGGDGGNARVHKILCKERKQGRSRRDPVLCLGHSVGVDTLAYCRFPSNLSYSQQCCCANTSY
jgi:hypothetical protein